ncbi:MAG: hypothetical protein AAFW84_14585 [Cyanobacteria bacterium J06635_15]
MLIADPWFGSAIVWGTVLVVGIGLTILFKLMQQHRRSRAVIPWLVGAMVGVSVLYLAIAGGWPALVYLVFITVFIAGILGTAISLVAGIIAAMVQRSLLKGARLGLNMVLGSLIAAVIAFAIGCRVASPGIFVEMANPETAGDGMLGITYSGLVLILAVLPATVIGAMMGGMLSYKLRH